MGSLIMYSKVLWDVLIIIHGLNELSSRGNSEVYAMEQIRFLDLVSF